MNLQAALSLLIGRLDESLMSVALGKEQNIVRAAPQAKMAFFMSRNVKVRASQDALLRAIREMSEETLCTLSQYLSEASCALSRFDSDGALRALQRIALAVNRDVRALSPEL